MAKTKTTFRMLGEEAERPREEEVEERMEERVEDRDEETTVNIISNEIKRYMHQEHRIDDKKVKTKGFIGRAIARARLGGFLSAKSKNIYLVAVTEFLRYLDTEKLTMKVSCINHKSSNQRNLQGDG